MSDIPKNLRLYVIQRRSKAKQYESLERQRDLINSLLKKYSATEYKALVLNDHSATAGMQWEALYEIIEQKKNGAKFDGLCASEYARVGRNMDDCEDFYRALNRAKLCLITHKEGLLTGRSQWMKRIGTAASNEDYARALSVNMNGGMMSLMKRGIIPHTQIPLYATDRLHISLITGEHLFRLRWTADGRVLRLDPTKPDAENPVCLYSGPTRADFPRRQRDEKVVLVLGDPDQTAVVRRIFEMKLVKDYGFTEIADALNADRILTPTGRKWGFVNVRAIFENSAYTGVGRCCAHGSGVHSMRHKDGPVEFESPRQKEEDQNGIEQKQITRIDRPVSDWFATRCPDLRYMLPIRLRRMAKAANHRRRRRSPEKNRVEGHRRSKYVLSGLVYDAGGIKMWGITTKICSGKPYRYYHSPTTKHYSAEMRRPESIKMIPADLIERAFLDLVRELLSRRKSLEDHLMKVANARLHATLHGTDGLQKLIAERKECEDHLCLILNAGPRGIKLAKKEVERLNARIDSLDDEIANSKRPGEHFLKESDAVSVVKSVVESLLGRRKMLAQATMRQVRQLARLMVKRIIFDGVTGLVQFELRLPKNFILNPHSSDLGVYIRGNSLSENTATAYEPGAMPLGVYKFKLRKPFQTNRAMTIEFLGTADAVILNRASAA